MVRRKLITLEERASTLPNLGLLFLRGKCGCILRDRFPSLLTNQLRVCNRLNASHHLLSGKQSCSVSHSFQHFTRAAPGDTVRTAISSDKSQHTNLCFVGSSQRQVWKSRWERVKVGCRGLAGRLLKVSVGSRHFKPLKTSWEP